MSKNQLTETEQPKITITKAHDEAHEFLINVLNLNTDLPETDFTRIMDTVTTLVGQVVAYELIPGDIASNIKIGIEKLLEERQKEVQVFSPSLHSFVLMVKFLENFYTWETAVVNDKQEAEERFKIALKHAYDSDIELEAKEALKQLYNSDKYHEAFIANSDVSSILGQVSDLNNE